MVERSLYLGFFFIDLLIIIQIIAIFKPMKILWGALFFSPKQKFFIKQDHVIQFFEIFLLVISHAFLQGIVYYSNYKIHHDKRYENLSEKMQNELVLNVIFKRKKHGLRHGRVDRYCNWHSILWYIRTRKLLKYIFPNNVHVVLKISLILITALTLIIGEHIEG